MIAIRVLMSVFAAIALTGCEDIPGMTSSTLRDTVASGKLSEKDVKDYITRQEERLATGRGTSHEAVTVDFEDVKFGASRSVNIKDQYEGIDGDTVYPVTVRYKSHRTWGNGDTETKEIYYSYEFYTDEYGDWNALLIGPARD